MTTIDLARTSLLMPSRAPYAAAGCDLSVTPAIHGTALSAAVPQLFRADTTGLPPRGAPV